ncbi:MAG: hypothetical protein GX488_00735 [Clostridiales bacterium]|nr:hypothetical protein [Clostridiales bacterium]
MHIKIGNDLYPCTGYYPTAQDVRFEGVEGLTPPLTGSITLVSEDNGLILAVQDCGDYARQTYAEGMLTLTNEPEPPAPTAEELLATARAEAYGRIKGKCSAAIMSGVTVGDKHYRLNEDDQTAINAAVALVAAGETQIPFAADDGVTSMYTAEAVKEVAQTAYKWVLANRKYNAALYAWITRETDTAVLAAINYGSALPDDLAAALTAQLTAAGIDSGALAGLLN